MSVLHFFTGSCSVCLPGAYQQQQSATWCKTEGPGGAGEMCWRECRWGQRMRSNDVEKNENACSPGSPRWSRKNSPHTVIFIVWQLLLLWFRALAPDTGTPSRCHTIPASFHWQKADTQSIDAPAHLFSTPQHRPMSSLWRFLRCSRPETTPPPQGFICSNRVAAEIAKD